MKALRIMTLRSIKVKKRINGRVVRTTTELALITMRACRNRLWNLVFRYEKTFAIFPARLQFFNQQFDRKIIERLALKCAQDNEMLFFPNVQDGAPVAPLLQKLMGG